MFLELSQKLESQLTNLLAQQSFIDSIDNLTLAHYEGKHILSCSHKLAQSLISAPNISQKTKGILQKIKSQYTESQTLKRKLSVYISVDHGASDRICSERVGEQNRFTVPYEWFSDSQHIQKTRLLCEDDDDAKVYMGILRSYLVANKLRPIEIAFRPSGSGGNSIHDRLRECEIGEGITLCIVDSDRKWPGAALGQTAHQLRRTFDNLDEGATVAHVIVLECHELENILPKRLIEAALPSSSDPSVVDRIFLACELGILGECSPNWHHDLKDGIKNYDILISEVPAHRTFVLSLVQRHSRRLPPVAIPCDVRAQCNKRSECSCIFFEGFSDILLKKVASYIERITSHKLCEIMFSGNQPPCAAYWQQLSAELLGWGCAYKRMRV
ncbi:hypothetical protein [Haliangium sp. UPWRP_2]|uniref:hypothetical protein n=1 Tax=Haliangium sp. UPWRP_2 TaxID=1931276 RepID=UPI0011B219AC|nr:hypothetical protein [Haliangium sp. UPWRP_2]